MEPDQCNLVSNRISGSNFFIFSSADHYETPSLYIDLFFLNKYLYFSVEFLPSATVDRTHHILLHVCDEPAKPPGETWYENQFCISLKNFLTFLFRDCEHTSICKGQPKIIYAWARNAPPFALPPNVGVPLGKNNGTNYVVLLMHYTNKFGGRNTTK